MTDPTRPPIAVKQTAKTSKESPRTTLLSAVLFSDDRRVAVIDGRVLREGDRVGDAVVTEIFADGVKLARGGHVQVMRLPKSVASIKLNAAAEN